MVNFWNNLKQPFSILAPMDDVTDVVFREIVSEVGRPDVFFTEFTNVEGLNSVGRDSQISRFKFTENQRPIVGQIWGLNPENFYKTAKLLKQLKFDGIDINMGCPEKSVVRNGTCAALIKNRKLASAIIKATIKGAGGLPVSVKTRLGLREIETEDWIGFLLGFDLAAITIHGRTAKEMSKVPAHWDEIGKAVKLRNLAKSKTLIIGNGDITCLDGVELMHQKYGVDGVMIGRGIFENIYLFADKKIDSQSLGLKLLLRHTKLFNKIWGSTKNFLILRKFFKIYLKDLAGSKELRIKFMSASSLKDVESLIKNVRT